MTNKTKIEFKWERVEEDTWRVKIIGGWIVEVRTTYEGENGNAISNSCVFVSDPEHNWEVLK